MIQRHGLRALTLLALAAALPACQTAQPPEPTGNNVCALPYAQAVLPQGLEETSGVAASREHPGVFWTHNDSGGDPSVFAVDSAGRVLAIATLAGATNRDWEDIAVGPCEPGADRDCIFVGEIGDNNERYGNVAVYRIPEPEPAGEHVVDADIFRFTYPGGPRDAEGLFVAGSGLHVVSKGRSHAIEVYRIPVPYHPDRTVTAEHVQQLLPPPTSASSQATAAALDREENRLAVRTYSGLRFFDWGADSITPLGRMADLVAPHQLQGEGVDFLEGDRLVVTGEAKAGRPPTIALLRCDPLRPPADTLSDPSL